MAINWIVVRLVGVFSRADLFGFNGQFHLETLAPILIPFLISRQTLLRFDNSNLSVVFFKRLISYSSPGNPPINN